MASECPQTLTRAEELPALIAQSSCPLERERYREEQAALGNIAAMRARKDGLEHELRVGLLSIRQPLRAATDAAKMAVTTAAGGDEAVEQSPFASRHLHMLARYRDPLPPTERIKLRLGLVNVLRKIRFFKLLNEPKRSRITDQSAGEVSNGWKTSMSRMIGSLSLCGVSAVFLVHRS